MEAKLQDMNSILRKVVSQGATVLSLNTRLHLKKNPCWFSFFLLSRVIVLGLLVGDICFSVGRVETVGIAACHWLGSLLVDLTAAATACDLALLSPLSLPVLW